MTIEEMKKYEWTICWSGGKDSTATVVLCHLYNIPIKEIIYVRMMYDDKIPATLPVMVDFVDSTVKRFEEWGYTVRIVNSKKSAFDLISSEYKRSKKHKERNNKKYGITAFVRGHCYFTRIKTLTIDSISKSEYEMIGYAFDELTRTHRLTDFKQSIMCALKITEKQAFDICRKYNLLSPLYELGFYRDGCWFCPNAGKQQREYLKYHHPELYMKICDSIEMCDYDLISVIDMNNWLSDYIEQKNDMQITMAEYFGIM